MRIAQVCATFPPYHGGAGNVCDHQSRELARCGFDVHVFTPSLKGTPPLEACLGYVVHRLPPLLTFGNAAVLPALFRRLRGFDLIHLHHPFYGGESAALAARLLSAPLVITYHQDVLLPGLAGLLEVCSRFTLEKAVLRTASRVLFTSLDYYRHSHARKLLSGREAAVRELPNGVDVERFHPGSPPELRQDRFPGITKPFIVLLVSGLDRAHSFKGVGVLLRALSLLPADVFGVIVGDGDLRPHYQRLGASTGVSPRLFFAGHVPDSYLPGFYTAADVTVLPSVHQGEAFGLVLLESMACATPVIASNLPGVRTVVDDGVDGFLTMPGSPDDLAEKILRLKQDPSLCRRMGAAGREKTVERYAWGKVIPRLIQTYNELAGPP